MEKLVKFSIINACADKVTKVDTDIYAADLNEKSLNINIQIISLTMCITLGLITLILGVFLARYAVVAAEQPEKSKEEGTVTE